MSLKHGDVLPIELPDTVTARVDGVPVLECDYGSRDEQRALRVQRVIDHANAHAASAGGFVKGSTPKTEEHDQ